MPPTLTSAERALLTTVTNRVRTAQDALLAAGKRCGQARSGQDAEFTALGLTAANLTSSRTAGVTAHVHEYEGPQGRGWELEITLARGGVTWRKIAHFGPETYRERDWFVVPEVV
jgi:hypothetical protein